MREAHAADACLWDQHLLDKLCALLISLNTCATPPPRWLAWAGAALHLWTRGRAHGGLVAGPAAPALHVRPSRTCPPPQDTPHPPAHPIHPMPSPRTRSSVVREFRYVATLTGAQLVTSWVAVQLALGEARDTAERQLAAEERKKGGKVGRVGCGLCLAGTGAASAAGGHAHAPATPPRAPAANSRAHPPARPQAAAERVAAFRRTVDRCHARVQELRSYAELLFQGVFAHRFRWAGPRRVGGCWVAGRGAAPGLPAPAGSRVPRASQPVAGPADLNPTLPDAVPCCARVCAAPAGTARRTSVPR